MPSIVKSVEKVFKKKPKTFGNPDEAVALGAALYVAYKSDPSNLTPLQKRAISKVNISDVTTKFFGTSVVKMNSEESEGLVQNDILIRKGEKLPCSITKDYATIVENQTRIDCDVTESNVEEKELDFVKKIWEGKLDLPPGRPANQQIKVTFSYDENQTMKCSFVDVESNKKTEINLSLDNENIQTDIDINDFKVD